MVQLILTFAIFVALVIPAGNYLYCVASDKKTIMDRFADPVDRCIYRICKIDKDKGMNWKTYAVALMVTNMVMMLAGYAVLRIQSLPVFNPNGISGMETTLSFNTIISFMTNTNLQHYAGETGMSYLSQMLVVTFMMFMAAGSGYAACIAFIRGLAGASRDNVGNFYKDLVRITTRVLIPFSFTVTLLLIWQGVPQNLGSDIVVETLDGMRQVIATGPVATLESIKHIGTNGGGFLGANSATPIENPTILSNMIELYSMMILPGACVITFGKMIKDRKQPAKTKNAAVPLSARLFGREGRSLFLAMTLLFAISLSVCYQSELRGNPMTDSLGVIQNGSMEGKETRFGIEQSAMFTATTTSFTTGSVNNMHDTLTPMGGFAALLNMMLNVVFGGKGTGLMNMLMYAILAVFICGLMIGRTPEYLGKKIEGKEMKLVALCIIIHPLLVLSFSALAVSVQAGLSSVTNPGFHGLSQILYEFASSAANNGSGFEGLADNTAFWNITTGFVMLAGRYFPIVLQLAVAGSLMKKQFVSESSGSLHTDGIPFAVILVFVVYIFAALTFFPALALGPVAEHLTLWS